MAQEIEGNASIQFFDVGTPDGLAEAAFCGSLSTPSLVLEDDEGTQKVWVGEVPNIKEVLAFLKK